MSWVTSRDRDKYGVAIENFWNGDEMCLKLSVGDTVHVLEVYGMDWAYGYITNNVDIKGIFPRAYIQDGKQEFHTTYHEILQLIDLRKKILSGQLPLDELKHLQQEVTQRIDLVNRLLGLDLVVRDDQGNILNTNITSTTKLFRRHMQTDERLAHARAGTNCDSSSQRRKPHLSWTAHVHFTNIIVKVPCLCSISVVIHMVDAELRSSPLTEPYVFQWTPQGYTDDNDLYNKLQCLYTDLNNSIVSDASLWLIGTVVQEGRAPHSAVERRVSTASFLPSRRTGAASHVLDIMPDNLRRAYGVMALDITELVRRQKAVFSPSAAATLNTTPPEEGRARFALCGEKESLEAVTRRLLLQGGDGSKASDESVVITLALHNGDIEMLRHEHPHYLPFKEVCVAPRMRLAEVIVPGYVRNDLYVTMLCADIARGNKMTDRNIEVTVRVYYTTQLLRGVLSSGVGRKQLDEYRTVTYHHDGRPRWHETVKVAIPIDQFKGAHLRFLFRHRSMNEVKEKVPRPFALAFVKLMQSNGTTLCNVAHELYVYSIDTKKWREGDFDYLDMPWLRGTAPPDARPSCNGLSLAPRDSFSIATTFCSTKLTQDVNLLKLLEWSERLSGSSAGLLSNGETGQEESSKGASVATDLKECLSHLRRVSREELVIFLQDTLDVLLHLLVKAPDTNNLDDAVFEALVDVVYIANEQHKGEPVQQVLKSYIEHNFSAAMVYSKLIYLLKDYVERCARITCVRRSFRSTVDRTVSAASLERVDLWPRQEDTISLPDQDTGSDIIINGDVQGSKEPSAELYSLLNKTLKCLPHLMKFIVKSRQLYAQYYVQGHDEFCKSLEGLFHSLADLMSNNVDVMVSMQGQCLRYIPATIPDVITVFSPLTLSKLLIKLLENLSPGQLTQRKLTTIKDICHSELFVNTQCRELLLKSFVRQLQSLLTASLEMVDSDMAMRGAKSVIKAKKLLGEDSSKPELNKEFDRIKNQVTNKSQEVNQVAEILEDILDVLHSEQSSPGTLDHMHFFTSQLLQQILELAYRSDHQAPITAHYVVVLMGLVRQLDEAHLYRMLSAKSGALVPELVIAIKNFVENQIFKTDWAQMTLLLNHILLTLLRVCAKVISERMREPFKKDNWNNWFQCTIKFITQPALQLEKFLPSKRNKVRAQYQDMRKIAAEEVKKMWYGLGQHKVAFIVQGGNFCLVAPMLEMTLIPEPELRRSTIPIFFDMMQCEYYSSIHQPKEREPVMGNKTHQYKGNFEEFENEMLVRLDQYVGSSSGFGDDHYCNVFSSILGALFSQHAPMHTLGKKFVQTISSQLRCLLQYRSILDSPGHSVETRMCCIAHLLDFYAAFSNKELYVRYVNKLMDLHLHTNNLTEAGFALYEHAKILSFDHVKLPQALLSPRYSHIVYHDQLKEKLYEDIIKYMEEGQMWECALDRCKELVEHYEHRVMDYVKLSKLLFRMSVCYEAIMNPSNVRAEPEYFRVAYYGRGFPGFLQNKVFVHRGNGFERLSDFQSRLLDQFPNAELLTKLTPPEEEKQESAEQYVQINKVECVVEENKFTRPGVSEAIRRFYRVNNIKNFTYSRPFHRGERVKDNEFATLCVEKTHLSIAYSLPGILRCFPVVRQTTTELSPVQHAVESMRSNNKDVQDLVLSHNLLSDLPLDALTRKLSGMIDAAVMGGVANYEKAFLQDDYIAAHPEQEHDIEELKSLIKEMVPLLELGLMVHAARVSDQITDLHDHMVAQFRKMKEMLASRYGTVPFPDLDIHHRSLRVLRQVSVDGGASTGRFSHNAPPSESSQQSLHRLSVGSACSTLPRNKLSTASLPGIGNKTKKDKFRSLLRRESYTAKEGQSQFYDHSSMPQPPQQPIIEISETLVPERPSRSEALERRHSRPPSIVSTTASNSSTPTPSTGGSFESLTVNDTEPRSPATDLPPPLPLKTRPLNDSDRSSAFRPNTSALHGSGSMSFDSGLQLPPDKPPRPAPYMANTHTQNNNNNSTG